MTLGPTRRFRRSRRSLRMKLPFSFAVSGLLCILALPALVTAATGIGSAKIAFARNTGPMSGDVKELYVMNADGSGQTRLARLSSYGTPPAWSPDGRELAYVLGRGGPNTEIYVARSDGSGQRKLTHTPGLEVFPLWSPDGRKLVFSRIGNRAHNGLYVINANGSGERKLTEEA